SARPGKKRPSDARDLEKRADPRIAPTAPEERELPLEIFNQAKVTIAAGTWNNPRALEVTRYSLDADQDGKPEQIRYYDRETNALLRVELDRDYNGKLDAWQDYENGALVRRTLDEDG